MTKSLAGSLADGVLADAILIPPLPPILPINRRRVRGRRIRTRKKRGELGWLNTSLKYTETRDEPLNTLYLQSKINFKMPIGA